METRGWGEALGPWVAHMRMTDQWNGTICKNFGRMHHEEHFCEIFLIWPVVQEKMLFKRFPSGALAVFLFAAAEPFMQF